MATRGLLSLALLTLPMSVAATTAHDVLPGGVVRWVGEGVLECEQQGRRFAPLDGACYFAVDLGAEGEIAVAHRGARGWQRRALRVGPYPYPTQAITGVEEKYVSPSPVDLERIERERREIEKLWRLATPRRFSLPLGSPLASLPQGGRFGARRTFNGQPRSPHGGADYRAAPGTPVYAPAAGRVALAADQFFAGQAVYLDHGDGLISMVFHLSRIAVRSGAEVKKGQLLGAVGATGRVTGPHLHFGLRWRGARVDPSLLLGAPDELPTLLP